MLQKKVKIRATFTIELDHNRQYKKIVIQFILLAARSIGLENIVQTLITKGAAVNAVDRNNISALSFAAANGNVNVICSGMIL